MEQKQGRMFSSSHSRERAERNLICAYVISAREKFSRISPHAAARKSGLPAQAGTHDSLRLMLIYPETDSPEGCEKPLSQTCQEPGGWNDPIRQVRERPSKNPEKFSTVICIASLPSLFLRRIHSCQRDQRLTEIRCK